MSTSNLTDLECRVLSMLTAGDDDRLAALRAQLEVVRVVDRDITGGGFYTSLEVPAGAPAASGLPRRMLEDVKGEVEGCEHGAGFILWLENGYLACLEGYAHGADALEPGSVARRLTWVVGVAAPVPPGSSARVWRLDVTEERDLAWALNPQ